MRIYSENHNKHTLGSTLLCCAHTPYSLVIKHTSLISTYCLLGTYNIDDLYTLLLKAILYKVHLNLVVMAAAGTAASPAAGTVASPADGPGPSKKRRSYTRDEKLKVVAYYKDHCNLYKTCQHFNMSTKNVLRWVKQEGKLKNSKRGSR